MQYPRNWGHKYYTYMVGVEYEDNEYSHSA